jgi:hypothetical protein
LDGDHDNDVLSASWIDGKIACYENQDGMGTFGPQRVITLAAVGASSVVASDVDGDGDLDVLSASWADDKIAWYQNQDGAGSFGSQQVISALATGASAVFAVDLNGDGQRDVLTAPSWSDELAWYPLCYFDCNANGIPDDRDIAGQGSTDQDRNGVPDECEACAGLADCADSNGDGIRDVACAWYECTGGACVATDRSSQADLGDLSGACPPDGACDGGDRFHVLNCFSNKDTMGAPPYPCEEHAPVALNADAGGVAACMLDGVCDGNDAFHALNCFSNVWFDGGIGYQCLCGPAPSAAPAPVRPQEQAALALKAPTNARPGALITVDVHLQGSLKALRGYQLHLASTGGSGGAPELVDILVDTERRDHALASAQGVWSAFNLNVAQVLVGMDAPEGVPAPAGAYLATFVYRLPQGAPDTCMVELRYEGQSPNPADRTFLFGAYGRSIAVDPVSRSAAQIQVLQARPRHAWD